MESVFQALADPTRRQLLATLRQNGPQSIKALSEPLAMTRQAVTKHLRALVEAGLVVGETAGRQRIHRLDAEPLLGVAEWLSPFEEFWDDRLNRLRRHLEAKE